MGTYNVIYHGNGNILGSVPIDNNDYDTGNIAIVLDNTNNLSKPRFTWGGWNTSPDGTGTSYFPADTITIAFSDIILYALWIPIIGLVVVYNGNGNTLGNAPIDTNGYVQGQAFTVLDNSYNLTKTEYIFAGWNTSADGTGVNFYPGELQSFPPFNITLYATWIRLSRGMNIF